VNAKKKKKARKQKNKPHAAAGQLGYYV